MIQQLCRIIDSTLREGEQAPGIRFSSASRRAIISHLHKVGVDEIELGVSSPVNNYLPQLVADAREGTNAACRLGLWCRCVEDDIAFAGFCRPDVLSLSIPVSDLHITERLQKDRDWVKKKLAESIRQGLSLNIPYISVGLEDASRADLDFLLQVARIAEENGARRVRLADTVGICSPATMQEIVLLLKDSLAIDIGVHCHNDFGMATANSIAALESGVQWIDTTVLGLGERAGNCRLEEVVGFMALIQQDERYRSELLPELCRLVGHVTGTRIPKNHPIVGEAIFTCETGIHLHGLSVNPATYEPYAPGDVGTQRTFRYGHKTGKRAINLQLVKQGFQLSDSQINHLVDTIRTNGTPLSEEQLLQFALENMQ